VPSGVLVSSASGYAWGQQTSIGVEGYLAYGVGAGRPRHRAYPSRAPSAHTWSAGKVKTTGYGRACGEPVARSWPACHRQSAPAAC